MTRNGCLNVLFNRIIIHNFPVLEADDCFRSPGIIIIIIIIVRMIYTNNNNKKYNNNKKNNNNNNKDAACLCSANKHTQQKETDKLQQADSINKNA